MDKLIYSNTKIQDVPDFFGKIFKWENSWLFFSRESHTIWVQIKTSIYYFLTLSSIRVWYECSDETEGHSTVKIESNGAHYSWHLHPQASLSLELRQGNCQSATAAAPPPSRSARRRFPWRLCSASRPSFQPSMSPAAVASSPLSASPPRPRLRSLVASPHPRPPTRRSRQPRKRWATEPLSQTRDA
jgi:hypothetical protein